MRRVILAVAALALVVTMAGCKTKAVSKTFDADMQRTWAAAVAVSEKVSKEKPEIDVVNRKIVTGWVYENMRTQPEQGPVIKRSTDVWRGIVTCKMEGRKTKVTVRLQKGDMAAVDNTGNQDRSAGQIGVAFWSSDESPQNDFLAKIAEELAKTK